MDFNENVIWLLVTITNPQCTNCLTEQKFSRCPTKRQQVKPQKWMATQPDPDYTARTPQVDQYLACLGQYQITQLADRVNETWQRSFLSPPPRNNKSINQQWIWLTVSSPYFILPVDYANKTTQNKKAWSWYHTSRLPESTSSSLISILPSRRSK